MDTELWFTEKQTPHFGITAKVRRTLHTEQTRYQDLSVLDTVEWGRMLVLDGMVMTTEKDEFVYHEMLAHPALVTHPSPKQVLVIGGGDGGVVREVLKHSSVEKVTLVEIDEAVILSSKKYLREIAERLDDKRVEVRIEDGVRYVQQQRDTYDVVLVDSTEPVGPAIKLFERPFYKAIYDSLKEDGMLVAQTDNPWFKGELIRQVFHDISEVFPLTRLYTANIPTYPSGLWSFTFASKRHDPMAVKEAQIPELKSRYYTSEIHHAAFALPRFIKDLVR